MCFVGGTNTCFMSGMARLPATCRICTLTPFVEDILSVFLRKKNEKFPTDGSSLFVVCFGSLGGPLLERSVCDSAPLVLRCPAGRSSLPPCRRWDACTCWGWRKVWGCGYVMRQLRTQNHHIVTDSITSVCVSVSVRQCSLTDSHHLSPPLIQRHVSTSAPQLGLAWPSLVLSWSHQCQSSSNCPSPFCSVGIPGFTIDLCRSAKVTHQEPQQPEWNKQKKCWGLCSRVVGGSLDSDYLGKPIYCNLKEL